MATPEQKYGRVTPPRSNIWCRPQAFSATPKSRWLANRSTKLSLKMMTHGYHFLLADGPDGLHASRENGRSLRGRHWDVTRKDFRDSYRMKRGVHAMVKRAGMTRENRLSDGFYGSCGIGLGAHEHSWPGQTRTIRSGTWELDTRLPS